MMRPGTSLAIWLISALTNAFSVEMWRPPCSQTISAPARTSTGTPTSANGRRRFIMARSSPLWRRVTRKAGFRSAIAAALADGSPAETRVFLMRCSNAISCLLSGAERSARAASTVASATRQIRLCTRSASRVRYTRLTRRSSRWVRRSTQPLATSRSIMRPAVAFSTSIISASSECDAPGRRCRRVSTSHCARVMPRRRTRRSNSVRSRRATSEITTPMYSSVFGMPPL